MFILVVFISFRRTVLRFSDYLHVSRFYVAFIGIIAVVVVAFLCSGNMQFALKRVTLPEISMRQQQLSHRMMPQRCQLNAKASKKYKHTHTYIYGCMF